MSSLTDIEKRYLEELFNMRHGYVLDFTDAMFGGFFQRYNIDIHSLKYQEMGTSKAKKLRAFWKSESDQRVGAALSGMLDEYEADCDIHQKYLDTRLLEKARAIAGRLTGKLSTPQAVRNESAFLALEFAVPNIQKMPIDARVMPIIETRLNEARAVLGVGAYLSVILMCGSVLEAILLGAARKTPEPFNRANATPKAGNGSPKQFHEWSLAQLIDVACEIDLLKPDVKKFSHGLRDFRNYIHPHQQMESQFKPDEHTAKMCFQALKAALASLAGERA